MTPSTKEHMIKYEQWFNDQLNQLGDWEWSENKVDARLKDAANNTTVLFEQINDFFSSIDAPVLREGNIQKFVDEGFNTIEKIIMMTEHQMVSLIGTNGHKIYKGLRNKLTYIPMYVLMGSCSTFGRGVGVRRMKKLYQAFKGDITKMTDEASIVTVEGFDIKTAKKIVKGYPVFVQFLTTIKEYVTIAPYEEGTQAGVLAGQCVVFTGFRDKNLHADVEAAGGTMQSAVSGKTTILVAADTTSNSSKMNKAREAGIKIINPEELRNMLC
jgi:NAD-dependent DNA ligase